MSRRRCRTLNGSAHVYVCRATKHFPLDWFFGKKKKTVYQKFEKNPRIKNHISNFVISPCVFLWLPWHEHKKVNISGPLNQNVMKLSQICSKFSPLWYQFTKKSKKSPRIKNHISNFVISPCVFFLTWLPWHEHKKVNISGPICQNLMKLGQRCSKSYDSNWQRAFLC